MEELNTAWKGVSKYFIYTVLTCYLISLHFGFYGWILYTPEVLIHFFYNVSDPSQLPDASAQMFFMNIALDLFPLGALVGSLVSGYMADKFGRKGSMVVTNILSIISVILFACKTMMCPYELTMCAHLLNGICVGVNLCLIYVYLFEISPRPIRGGVLMLTNFFVRLGNVIAQIVTFLLIRGYKKGWYVLLFLTGIFPLTLIFLLSIIPESPRYLLIQKEDEEKARKVLRMLKVSRDIEEEIEELRQENLSEKEEEKKDNRDFDKISSSSWILFSVIFIMGGIQFVGFHKIYYHNFYVLRSTKMNYISIWFLKTAISLLLCFVALLVTYLVDYLGRRILFLTGLAICTVSLVLMVVGLELLENQVNDLVSHFCVALLVVFTAAYTLGPGIIAMIIAMELFFQSTRASSIAIVGFAYCLVNIFLTLIEDTLKKKLGSYSLLTFTPVCLAVFIYFYKYIPETKNQTLPDIRKMLMTQKSKKVQVKADKARKKHSIIF
ncbi:solute carrier family 2, facilitated glucose transporter member 5-like [Erythrolamprus reginae]|uniref:solute carrier family 2, facilitated glucose transporter member 5-like n=1 Tax=Erythrolamprus reginae TaxID=121349 RepID=UPI00396C4CB4